MEHVVTVGLDGSAESLAAARWAAHEADLHGFTLRLLHAWILLAPESAGVSAEEDQNYWAKRIVHDAEAELHSRYPRLRITGDLVAEDAATALLDAAARSRMLVLGSRGLEAIQSFFLGDTSLYVVARADRPVVLVRAGTPDEGDTRDEGQAGVAVGLSLHGPCDGILEFAFEAAAVRGLPLNAVHGRNLPVSAYAPWSRDPDVAAHVREVARKELSETLRPWQEKFPGVRVNGTVRLESPSRAVVWAAHHAALLVVGGRHHRPALGPHIGPVAHAAAHHAACPVAVVPHEAE